MSPYPTKERNSIDEQAARQEVKADMMEPGHQKRKAENSKLQQKNRGSLKTGKKNRAGITIERNKGTAEDRSGDHTSKVQPGHLNLRLTRRQNPLGICQCLL